MTERESGLIRQLFAGYFHEDWSIEGSPDEVLGAFIADHPLGDELQIVARAIDALLEKESNDEELDRTLFQDLGCYYLPSGDGIQTRDWLAHVARTLACAARAS